jgi:hypothetical protein
MLTYSTGQSPSWEVGMEPEGAEDPTAGLDILCLFNPIPLSTPNYFSD